MSIELYAQGPGNVFRPPNEFSRKYNVESILGGGPRQRDFRTSIEAKEEERNGLANRFELFNIDKLKADLMLRKEGRLGGSTKVTGVHVEGTVVARVTQTCVRTGEKFDVDVEFPLFAIVRPLEFFIKGKGETEDLSELDSYVKKNSPSPRKQKKIKTPDRNINEMDMMELQMLLQDFDVEDDVMEDEAIFSKDGTLDIGELVAQLFWLKLDPYPKKPGTGPINVSISG